MKQVHKSAAVLFWFCLAVVPEARADSLDASVLPEQDAAEDDAGVLEGIQPTTTPDNFGCALSAVSQSWAPWALGLLGLALLLRLRARRAGLLTLSVFVLAPMASATVNDDAPLASPRGAPRRVALSWNPLTLHLEHYGANVEVLVASHHALVLSPFYAWTRTNADSNNNVFRGIGGELGYRWYEGHDGPRGFFLGPSVLLGSYTAVPKVGSSVPFWNFGLAVDVGYQALVADRWVVGLGAGLQYTIPTETFPQQELPASVVAIRGLRPRLLVSLGAAF
ncbi:MAG: DUF3575 domain-containing protein [Myxococcales bacterium]